MNLSQVNNLIDRACFLMNEPSPGTYVANSTARARQLLNMFYTVCEQIRTRRYWPQLKKVYTFATEVNREFYQLPQDFYAAMPFTNWDKTNRWQMLGPLWDNQYSYRQYGYVTSENRTAFQIFGPDFNPAGVGGQFRVNPIPGTAGTEFTFNYISASYITAPNWLPLTALTLGMLRNVNGRVYTVTTAGTTGTVAPNHTSGTFADGSVVWGPPLATTYDTLVTDADLCLFDPSLVISGIRAMWKDEKAGDGTKNIIEFENEIGTAFARFNPMGKISLNGAGLELSGLNPNIGDGNFGS
jgi:hypothetical protein